MSQMIDKESLKHAIKAVWIRSLTEIQPDILEGLQNARDTERNERARQYLDIIIENHAFTDTNTAIQLARALEDFQITTLRSRSTR